MKKNRVAFRQGYTYSYLLTHPWFLIHELLLELKWFVQRGLYGYADCDLWGLCSYLATWLPIAVHKLSQNPVGHPSSFSHKEWAAVLTQMAKKLYAGYQLEDGDYIGPEGDEFLHREFREGLDMLVKYF